MSQSRKEGENQPGTPFPGKGPEDWELQFRNQLEALTINQWNQGHNQTQGHTTVILRPESDIRVLHPVPTGSFPNQRPLSFSCARRRNPRNITEGVWIDNESRARVAPNLHSVTHIGPSPLGNSFDNARSDEDMEMLASMMAAAFHEQQDATNVTGPSQRDIGAQAHGQAYGSGNSTADAGRRFSGSLDNKHGN
ncbi:hypothetical protein DTO207G8_6881 [Paecilomyces variotii]|nr:hypothetical protein DTO207G8_6881 [Paecilomyces variotii]KAJ9383522.1 hypothetical protein DTO063F5_5179 [Paecilomyces variotii]